MYFEQFTQYKDKFLSYIDIEKNLSINTQKSYKSDLNLFMEFWEQIEKLEPHKLLMKQAIERYFVTLYYKKIGKSSIARKISCFRSFERFLKPYNILINLKLKRPHIDKKLPTYLTVDEIFYLLDTIKNEELPTKKPIRDRAILELLYATGIRCSELCAIRLQDIDMKEKVIRIFGKGKKERYVLFGKKAQERLEEYFKEERPTPLDVKECLFISHSDEPLNQRTVQRIIYMFRSFLSGNKNITPHKIRHSFATHLLNQGADLRVVQELLGHATLASTEQYTHVTSSQLAHLCDTLHPLHKMNQEKK